MSMKRLLGKTEEYEIRERIRNMDETEIAVACEEIPTAVLVEEITKRLASHEQKIAECREILET